MKKKQTPFVERDPPKVTVAPSICPLVSESILDTLTDDVLELHEALQWFELENCKFSVHLSTDVFCFQEDRPFGATIDRDELSRFLEGDSLEICIIQTFMVMYRVASAQKGSGKPIKWNSVKVAQQTGSTECGYYVMRFMWEIISYSENHDIGKVWRSRSEPYTLAEFNDIRNIWSRYFLDVVLQS
ncbi:unnamed protein product [Cuscuta europaea]|uniref:Ubiquitin-like protease family profile domain-containing protein n=1 Tax=Cuscuta europaea TaxID=41803 RepID=A0A9P1EG74_CUSEU|nr:unnamed protein product [Cuscuta europaea]